MDNVSPVQNTAACLLSNRIDREIDEAFTAVQDSVLH